MAKVGMLKFGGIPGGMGGKPGGIGGRLFIGGRCAIEGGNPGGGTDAGKPCVGNPGGSTPGTADGGSVGGVMGGIPGGIPGITGGIPVIQTISYAQDSLLD